MASNNAKKNNYDPDKRMKKKRRLEEIQGVDLEKIRKIYEADKKRLDIKRQEDYVAYHNLERFASRKMSADTGRSSLISGIINGYRDFPVGMLPFFAQIGHCTIDDLFDHDSEINIKQTRFSANDILEIIRMLFNINIIKIDKNENGTYSIRFEHNINPNATGGYDEALSDSCVLFNDYLHSLYDLSQYHSLSDSDRHYLADKRTQEARQMLETKDNVFSKIYEILDNNI